MRLFELKRRKSVSLHSGICRVLVSYKIQIENSRTLEPAFGVCKNASGVYRRCLYITSLVYMHTVHSFAMFFLLTILVLFCLSERLYIRPKVQNDHIYILNISIYIVCT